MGLFEKLKKGLNAIMGIGDTSEQNPSNQVEETRKTTMSGAETQKPKAPDNNPKGKVLSWFASEEGLETLKLYTTPQNYMLEDTYKNEHQRKYSDYDFDLFMRIVHKDAKVPSLYFKALVDSIEVQPLEFVGPSETLVLILKEMAKPYTINDDGEPELCKTILTPEEIVSVDKNPVLYFVKNFNVFKIEDDALGSAGDKYALYIETMKFLAILADVFKIEENQWLFDKNTYLNDFGTVRKKKGFLNKCKELSAFPQFFDDLISKLD